MNGKQRLPAGGLLAGLAVVSLLGGCASTHGVTMLVPGQGVRQLEAGSALLPKGDLDFTVSALDTLQIDVFPKRMIGTETRLDFGNEIKLGAMFAGKTYRIGQGDTLAISVGGEKDLDSQVTVRPDGQITLFQTGQELSAVGLTPQNLAQQIAGTYAAVMVAPHVNVSIIKTNLDQLEKLQGNFSIDRDGMLNLPILGKFKALGETTGSLARSVGAAATEYFHNDISVSISTPEVTSREPDARLSPDGQVYFRDSVKVSPEENIFIPNAGVIATAGKTLSEIREEIRTKLQQNYQNPIDVRLVLGDSATLNVFIGGEVKLPGRYPFTGAMTVMQLIASAGWASDSGDLGNVILLHQSRAGQYVVYTSNLREIASGTAMALQDLRLTPRDIVIVPPTGVAQANTFVDQYIRRMLPFGISVNYSYFLNNPQSNLQTKATTTTSGTTTTTTTTTTGH